jgi:hypothetical protein
MTAFDLLFLAVLFATVVLVVLACLAALRSQRARAVVLLRRLGILAAVYLAVVILVSLASPRRVLNLGDEQCWDDWCIAVTNAHHERARDGQSYEVILRVSSRARRRAQRERGVHIYLMDNRARCYDAATESAEVPFDLLLQPQEAVDLRRVFHLPAEAQDPVLVVAHDGWFPGLFIIGDSGSLFHKRTVVRLE